MLKSPGYKVQSKKESCKKWYTTMVYNASIEALTLAYALHSVTRLQIRVISGKQIIYNG